MWLFWCLIGAVSALLGASLVIAYSEYSDRRKAPDHQSKKISD